MFKEALAHETYVLGVSDIEAAINQPSPNPFLAIPSHELQFIFWGLLVMAVIVVVLKISVSPLFERVFDPILINLKKIAPFLVRLTLGISLLASGYFFATFGPELPVYHILGEWAGIGRAIFIILGLMILLGWRTRETAVMVFFVYIYVLTNKGIYGLSYLSYLGAALYFVIAGGGMLSLDALRKKTDILKNAARPFEKYGFFILRLLFGFSVVFSAYYAKFLHSNLAIFTIEKYQLTEYLPFSPLFLVLGALLIELLVGLAIAFGFEVRFFALVFIFFLVSSILLLGEALWPHLILFGLNLAVFAHGYDKFTLEKALFQRKRRGEPVL